MSDPTDRTTGPAPIVRFEFEVPFARTRQDDLDFGETFSAAGGLTAETPDAAGRRWVAVPDTTAGRLAGDLILRHRGGSAVVSVHREGDAAPPRPARVPSHLPSPLAGAAAEDEVARVGQEDLARACFGVPFSPELPALFGADLLAAGGWATIVDVGGGVRRVTVPATRRGYAVGDAILSACTGAGDTVEVHFSPLGASAADAVEDPVEPPVVVTFRPTAPGALDSAVSAARAERAARTEAAQGVAIAAFRLRVAASMAFPREFASRLAAAGGRLGEPLHRAQEVAVPDTAEGRALGNELIAEAAGNLLGPVIVQPAPGAPAPPPEACEYEVFGGLADPLWTVAARYRMAVARAARTAGADAAVARPAPTPAARADGPPPEAVGTDPAAEARRLGEENARLREENARLRVEADGRTAPPTLAEIALVQARRARQGYGGWYVRYGDGSHAATSDGVEMDHALEVPVPEGEVSTRAARHWATGEGGTVIPWPTFPRDGAGGETAEELAARRGGEVDHLRAMLDEAQAALRAWYGWSRLVSSALDASGAGPEVVGPLLCAQPFSHTIRQPRVWAGVRAALDALVFAGLAWGVPDHLRGPWEALAAAAELPTTNDDAGGAGPPWGEAAVRDYFGQRIARDPHPLAPGDAADAHEAALALAEAYGTDDSAAEGRRRLARAVLALSADLERAAAAAAGGPPRG